MCECGCGQATSIANFSDRKRGLYKGYPYRFATGHSNLSNGPHALGAGNTSWKGGRYKNDEGYWLIRDSKNPGAQASGYMLEHRSVWERHNGRRLTNDEDVHHIDRNKDNNSPENLQAIKKADHQKLHKHKPRRKH
jgi:hypothetical protein